MNLGDIAGEGDTKKIVRPPADGLTLGHRLFAPVVVEQPLPLWADLPEKLSHGVGEDVLRQRSSTNDVLIQKQTSLHWFLSV